MITSRERIRIALEHREPDRVPLDLGSTPVTGMHVSAVYRLRQALGLDAPGTPVKVIEPFQMLGEIKPDLIEALGVDVVPLGSPKTLFGFRNENWKPWTTFDGTPVLVPEGFNTDPEPNGDILMYPEGDKSVPPSGRMPRGGWYFDAIIRQPPLDESKLNVEDNLEEFGPISDEDLAYFAAEADRLYRETDKAIVANFGGTSFGDIALVPAPWLKHPRGIRDVEEWYISTVTRRDYVYRVFERQCEIALANLERL
ncbi:MAG: methyltransferase, partial [Anaerolineae bacterium]|nr:methyltransferase [Anaerolineae bacterium]MDW8070098.1 methyltransferase [Anaerolineae bacterium]